MSRTVAPSYRKGLAIPKVSRDPNFASQDKQRAPVGIDAPDALSGIPLAGMEGDVAEEHLRAALP